MATTAKVRILNSLRGFAVIAVCCCHFGKPVSQGLVLPGFFAWLEDYGKYGVHVFFVVSGLVIPYSLYQGKYKLTDYPIFLYKRLIRLHPPYLVALLITFIIAGASYGIRHLHNPEDLDTLLLSSVYYHLPIDNPVFWTLKIEAEFYLFIGLFYVLLRKLQGISIILFIPFLLFLSQTPIVHFVELFKYIVFFIIGILGYLTFIADDRKLLILISLCAVVVFSFTCYEWPACVAALITVLMILYVRRPLFNGFNFVGKASYSIYLLHYIIGVKLINLLLRYVGPSYVWMLFILAMAISLAMAWLFWKYIEKPFAKLSGNVKYRHKSEEAVSLI